MVGNPWFIQRHPEWWLNGEDVNGCQWVILVHVEIDLWLMIWYSWKYIGSINRYFTCSLLSMVNDQWLLLICSKKNGNVNGWSSAWKTRCFKLFQVLSIRILQQELFTAEKRHGLKVLEIWPFSWMIHYHGDRISRIWNWLGKGVEKAVFFPGLFDCIPLSSGTKWGICIYVCIFSWGITQLPTRFKCFFANWWTHRFHGPFEVPSSTQTWQLRKSPFGSDLRSCFTLQTLGGFPGGPWLMTLEGINQYSIHIPFISPLCHYVHMIPASFLHPMKIA